MTNIRYVHCIGLKWSGVGSDWWLNEGLSDAELWPQARGEDLHHYGNTHITITITPPLSLHSSSLSNRSNDKELRRTIPLNRTNQNQPLTNLTPKPCWYDIYDVVPDSYNAELRPVCKVGGADDTHQGCVGMLRWWYYDIENVIVIHQNKRYPKIRKISQGHSRDL